MTAPHYISIPIGDDEWPTPAGAMLAADLILGAMSEDARHPVTVGYFESRKEFRAPKRGDGEAKWFPVPGQYVHTVRTMEFFDFGEVPSLASDAPASAAEPGLWFDGIDRCPRDDHDWLKHGPPRIRKVRADRITDLTVHTTSQYILRNAHFIKRVRDHAAAAGWVKINLLTDDALWSLIHLATDPDDAISRVRPYATVR